MVRTFRNPGVPTQRPAPGELPASLPAAAPPSGLQATLHEFDRQARARRVSPGIVRQISAGVPIEISNELEAWCREWHTTRSEFLRQMLLLCLELIRDHRDPREVLQRAVQMRGDG